MDKLKKTRIPVRQCFTKKINDLKGILDSGTSVEVQELLTSNYNRLEALMAELKILDGKIMDTLLDTTEETSVLVSEKESTEKYNDDYEIMRVRVNNVLLSLMPASPPSVQYQEIVNNCDKRKTYKLPKIEIKKFNGDLLEWLSFWSQFRKIHEDDSLHGSDKFQYLTQVLEIGTEPHEIALSYPQTSENYPKVIQALQERFGREDLLLQVYIRELLKLVISNATQEKKLPLPTLLIKLESHLRSLSSLKLKSADPSTWLFPLVESSLPEETLRAWQRSRFAKLDTKMDGKTLGRLECLLEFVRTEVQNEQQILLAQSGFSSMAMKSTTENRLRPSKTEKKHNNDAKSTPTVAAFHNDTSSQLCIFCSKPHESEKCFQTRKMSIEERRSKMKEKGRCYLCTRPNHLAKTCKSLVQCLICGKKHVTVMCPELMRSEKSTSESKEIPPAQVTLASTNNTCINQVVLQTLMVTLQGKSKWKTVRAFVDCGSQRSYILYSTANELELEPCAEETVAHVLFGGHQTSAMKHKRYKINVGRNDGRFTCEIELRDHQRICQSIPRVSRSAVLLKELKTKRIWISDIGENSPEIELLIGMDVYSKILTGNVIHLKNGLIAVETKLGWTLAGERQDQLSDNNLCNLTISMAYDDERSISELWNLETIGICDQTESKSTEEVKENLFRTLERGIDGRYIIKLPWRDGHPEITCNKHIAEKRLISTTEKLRKTNMVDSYTQIFADWQREGFIEEVPNEEIERPCHYLPHRPVIKLSSFTTPVRPVFDAACKTEQGVSLNDCLETGPNHVQLIPEILLRFREDTIGATSDIRKAFQMIEVATEDRDYLRFLWWEDGSTKKMKVYRHTRVVFGTTCSPFILGAVLEHHLSNVHEEERSIAQKLMEAMYVDNCVTSVSSKKEYDVFRTKSTMLLSDAKMELRNWECSGEDISLDEENKSENTYITTVLGLQWNRKLDTLKVELNTKFSTLPEVLTKRILLSSIQKVFDVIGFLTPALLPFKLLLQKAWRLETEDKTQRKKVKPNWDSPLPENITYEFRKRYQEMNCLKEVKIPRVITGGVLERNHWSLHTFVDASQHAYAAAVFLRTENQQEVSVQLLLAKARVAPLKSITIPRLELLGCLIGSRLAATVKTALHVQNVKEYYWSDSSTALAWIRRDEQWATFVGNRVKEIRKLTHSEDWKHIPGNHNPADLISRGCYPSQLKDSEWWKGPDWLKRPEGEWPSQQIENNEDETAILEERKKRLNNTVTMMTIEMTRNWSFSQQVRIVAWIFRFYNNARKNSSHLGPLQHSEIKAAELKIIKGIQSDAFPHEGDTVNGIKVVRDEEGLIRVKTKIVMRDDSLNFRYPLLLPKKHEIVEAIIFEQHRLHCHAGVQFLMIHLRKKYWIIQTRRTVKKAIAKCLQCRRHKVKNAESDPAPLPKDRVKDAKVFEVVGVDLAGPLILKDLKKVWIVIYTCAVFRAIHLELVSALSTEAFLLSLRRFIARRGRPSIVYSDNGTNFLGTANALRSPDVQKLQQQSRFQEIEWKFNPPTASWWGGWWERLVRSVKELLRRMLGKSVLTYEELLTSLCDVEAVINGRPLTYVSEDPEDLSPLTPSMFLNDVGDTSVQDIDHLEKTKLQSRLRYRQHLMQELKQRFRKEYLSQLIQRPKDKRRSNLKEGDVVLLGSEQQKRVEWPLARIVSLIPGKDGVSRVAKLKLEDRTLIRPIQRLYPLEIDTPEDIIASKKCLGKEIPQRYRTHSGRSVVPNPRYFS